ncbi:hypothetical protein C1645_870599 [Glomus cerebriforme]|uniref:Uncharacterized protein n=1 Tax=Glomus cerebriforme TaxID=658196 RepID=A0A397TJW3_9GLOM|nr:hypothetical protein C1645_870599 [Glomus cerebriforme]
MIEMVTAFLKSYEWHARFHSIKNLNSWCPYCAKHRITLEDVKQIAINKAPPKTILRGSWCLLCSKNRKPDFLKTLEHPRGLELDIPYYHYGFAIEVQGE